MSASPASATTRGRKTPSTNEGSSRGGKYTFRKRPTPTQTPTNSAALLLSDEEEEAAPKRPRRKGGAGKGGGDDASSLSSLSDSDDPSVLEEDLKDEEERHAKSDVDSDEEDSFDDDLLLEGKSRHKKRGKTTAVASKGKSTTGSRTGYESSGSGTLSFGLDRAAHAAAAASLEMPPPVGTLSRMKSAPPPPPPMPGTSTSSASRSNGGHANGQAQAKARRYSSFVAPPTPTLDFVFTKIQDLVQNMRIEATRDESFQTRSQAEVEASIVRLPTRKHRSALCLTMNRYSAFCASSSIDVPAFPITAYKIALFLVRATDCSIGATFRTVMPQTPTFPLPMANFVDGTPMGKYEGEHVTRELVTSWAEALGYAQLATRGVWLQAGVGDAGNVGPASVLAEPYVQEVLSCFEPLAMSENSSRGGRKRDASVASEDMGGGNPGGAAKKKTKWVRGGRSVEAPKGKGTSPFNSSLDVSPPPALAPSLPPLGGAPPFWSNGLGPQQNLAFPFNAQQSQQAFLQQQDFMRRFGSDPTAQTFGGQMYSEQLLFPPNVASSSMSSLPQLQTQSPMLGGSILPSPVFPVTANRDVAPLLPAVSSSQSAIGLVNSTAAPSRTNDPASGGANELGEEQVESKNGEEVDEDESRKLASKSEDPIVRPSTAPSDAGNALPPAASIPQAPPSTTGSPVNGGTPSPDTNVAQKQDGQLNLTVPSQPKKPSPISPTAFMNNNQAMFAAAARTPYGQQQFAFPNNSGPQGYPGMYPTPPMSTQSQFGWQGSSNPQAQAFFMAQQQGYGGQYRPNDGAFNGQTYQQNPMNNQMQHGFSNAPNQSGFYQHAGYQGMPMQGLGIDFMGGQGGGQQFSPVQQMYGGMNQYGFPQQQQNWMQQMPNGGFNMANQGNLGQDPSGGSKGK